MQMMETANLEADGGKLIGTAKKPNKEGVCRPFLFNTCNSAYLTLYSQHPLGED